MSVQAHGFRAWLLQRLSAVYIGLYIVIAFFYIVTNMENITYEKWQQILSQPFVNVSLLLFFYAIFLHIWIGSRDIIIDYIKPVSVRLVALTVIAFGIFVMLIWVNLVLFSVLQV
jgi:succinate dehydrogenase / fumarate reductase, membrane anchor subunit